MNVRSYAKALIEAETLAGKLEPPPAGLDDEEPGPALRLAAPGRPPRLIIAPAREVKVPPPAGMPDPAQRARILHALANHELQAAELFAWALLAFPEAPSAFRRGLLAILRDEQRHMRLYLERLAACGGEFGDFPVTGHFWNKAAAIATPLQFVCTMGLTFENANLDFAQDYAEAARAAEDHETAAVLAQVHLDEIRHVHFAWIWLNKLKEPETSTWETFVGNVSRPLGPERARGKTFDARSRAAAGLDEEFIERLAATVAKRPNGLPR